MIWCRNVVLDFHLPPQPNRGESNSVGIIISGAACCAPTKSGRHTGLHLPMLTFFDTPLIGSLLTGAASRMIAAGQLPRSLNELIQLLPAPSSMAMETK